jgi:hypothetical protein
MELGHIYIFRSPVSFNFDEDIANQAMASFSYEAAIDIALRYFPNPNPHYFNADYLKKDSNHLVWKLMRLIAENCHMKKHAGFVNMVFSEKHNSTQIKKILEEYI